MVVNIRIQADWKKMEKQLNQVGLSLDKALVPGIRRSAEAVVKQAQLNLTNNRSIAFGTLRQSIWYDMRGRTARVGPGLGNKATSGPTGSPKNYGVFVERGRLPGKWPPRQVMRLWIQRKLGVDPDQGNVEFLIRRAIGRKGVAPRPFLEPAAITVSKKIPDIVNREIVRSIQRQAGGK